MFMEHSHLNCWIHLNPPAVTHFLKFNHVGLLQHRGGTATLILVNTADNRKAPSYIAVGLVVSDHEGMLDF